MQSGSGDIVAIDPRLGLTRLAERQDAELRQRLAQTALAREAASELALHVEQRRRRNVPGIETIEGGAAVAARLMELMCDTHAEVLSMLTWQPTSESIRSAQQEDQLLLDRGVRVRLLVLQAHVRGSTDYAAHLHDISSRGAEVRVATTLPTRQVILDRAIAVVPADLDDPRQAASIVNHRTLVQLAFDAFESYWHNAADLRRRTVNSCWEPDALTLKVLELLAQGGKDEAISRRVGMSLRSVRRLISRVGDEVGAQSRFELAIQCSRRGWITETMPLEAGTGGTREATADGRPGAR
ncbi:hypothetical protein [Myceligenerans cantabricum]